MKNKNVTLKALKWPGRHFLLALWPFPLWTLRDYTWYLNRPPLWIESLRPRTRHKQQKKKNKKKERGTKKGQGSQGNEDMGEEGWRARLTALVALILLASLRLVVFAFMCLFYAFAAPLHGRIHKGSRADKGFVLFSFLLLTSYILWTLFSESYWSSRPQRHTTAEKNGVSVVLHRGVRPSQSHGTKRASGKP